MNLGQSFVSDTKLAIIIEPRHESLDWPAFFTQSAAMGRASFGQFGLDSVFSEPVSMRLGIISAVGEQLFGAAAWASALSFDRGESLRPEA